MSGTRSANWAHPSTFRPCLSEACAPTIVDPIDGDSVLLRTSGIDASEVWSPGSPLKNNDGYAPLGHL